MAVILKYDNLMEMKTTSYFLTAAWEENNEKMIQDFVIYAYTRENAIEIVNRELTGKEVTIDVIPEGSQSRGDIEAIYYMSSPMPANDEKNKAREILEIIARAKNGEFNICDNLPLENDEEIEPDYKIPNEENNIYALHTWIHFNHKIFLEELQQLIFITRDENNELKAINANIYYLDWCKQHEKINNFERMNAIIDILKSCYTINGQIAIQYLFAKYYQDIRKHIYDDDEVFD